MIDMTQTAVRIHVLLSSNSSLSPLLPKADLRGRTLSKILAREQSDDIIVFFTSSRGHTLYIEVPHIRPDAALIISLDEHSDARDDSPTVVPGGSVQLLSDC